MARSEGERAWQRRTITEPMQIPLDTMNVITSTAPDYHAMSRIRIRA
ncbi:hypothetical protein [Burkholderia diffusa]|nr:hypothetical protein [Burkholderia diffusa]